MPRLSVIIPVYNVDPYLRQCLDSVCAQTVDDMEVICVNDGSTDGSAAILAEYARRFPCLKVVTKSNGGLSSARNAGLEQARGEYVGFVDADDYVSIGMYQVLYAKAREADADVVECSVCVHADGLDAVQRGVLAEYFSSPAVEASPFRFESLKQCRDTVWDKLFRREFLSAHGLRFDVEQEFSEDSLFMAQVLTFCRSLVRLEDALYHYRYKRSGALTEGKDAAAYAGRVFRYRLREMRILASMWSDMGMMRERVGDLLAWLQYAVEHCLPCLPVRERRRCFAESVRLSREWVAAAPDAQVPEGCRFLPEGRWFRFFLFSSLKHAILHDARLCGVCRRIAVSSSYAKL